MYQVFPDRFARSAEADTHETPDWAIPAAWDDPVDPVNPGRSQQFYGGDGIVKKGIEDTLKSVGRLGKDGMKGTNEEIIKIMLE